MRYDYGCFTSLDRAIRALEHMYASGDVLASEWPLIERRGSRWFITLAGC